MSQSEVDEIFEWLKKTETKHEKTRRFKLMEHYIITFEQKPGWKMEGYQFDTTVGQTRFICRVFRPDGKHYSNFSVMGIIWNRLLRLVDISNAELKIVIVLIVIDCFMMVYYYKEQ